MSKKGYIKDYRKELFSDIWLMPPMYHRVWQWIKYSVNHVEGRQPNADGSITMIQPGQRPTSYREIARGVGYHEYGVWKEPGVKTIKNILDWLESQEMVSITRNSKGTLITVLQWGIYQSDDEIGNTKETIRKRSGNAEGILYKNGKNGKNGKNKELILGEVQNEPKTKNIPYKKIIDYLNDKTGKSYRLVESNKQHIRARFNEGYTEEDFLKVIDNKVAEWLNHEWVDKKGNLVYGKNYLRPATLFGTKFDTYLNQEYRPAKKQSHNDFLEMLESGYFDDVDSGGKIT